MNVYLKDDVCYIHHAELKNRVGFKASKIGNELEEYFLSLEPELDELNNAVLQFFMEDDADEIVRDFFRKKYYEFLNMNYPELRI